MNNAKTQAVNKLLLFLDGRLNNMTALHFISSAGFRALLSVPKAMTRTNGIMRAINVNPDILKGFDMTGFCGVLEIAA